MKECPLCGDRMKECPLCGEMMRLSVREVRERIPERGESAVRVTREWICPECDYFEETEAGEE
jgi:C4-type Zn-finger protein